MTARAYTAAELEAAVAALQAPDRLRHAQEVVAHRAAGLQRVLSEALTEGGWFGGAHQAQVAHAATVADPIERRQAVEALVGEEVRLGMLVGVAVGFELAHELQGDFTVAGSDSDPEGRSHPDTEGRPHPDAESERP